MIVFCGHDTVFTCPVGSAAAQRVIWSDRGFSVLKEQFLVFGKEKKVVELCGLFTALELGSAEGSVPALRLLQQDSFSFMIFAASC